MKMCTIMLSSPILSTIQLITNINLGSRWGWKGSSYNEGYLHILIYINYGKIDEQCEFINLHQNILNNSSSIPN